MTSVLRHRCGRALCAGALSVALLSGGTAGAYAVSSPPSPTSTLASPTTGMASITLHANKTAVKTGQTVKFSGRTKGLKIGTPLVLQHMKSGKWTNLRATAKVKKGSSYSILARLNTKGTETLRVAAVKGAAKVYSHTVTVKVS
ncbi:hypothetical protein AB0L75_18285 [Streptomyces sp. NPDC052101]|uniref:hypothetical protein n=1 Tax=Streptomyces sp. NPDC052101 TaxID=3155763 RepID=UPI003447FB46